MKHNRLIRPLSADAPADKALLVVGYTALNQRFGADFDALGELGYTVTAVDGTYSVAFVINMTDAPEGGRTFRVTGK